MKYEFQIRAIYANDVSGWSETVSVTTDASPLVLPDNVHSAGKMVDSITLEWNSVDIATGYEIQYRADGDFELWEGSPITGTSATIGGLDASTPYEFQIRAVNGDGESDWSESIFVTTVIPLNLPGYITSPGKTANTVTLAWNTVSNASGYEIQYKTENATVWDTWTEITTTAIIDGLTPNTTYEFQVRALGIGDYTDSDWAPATPLTVTTNKAVLAIPTGVTVNAGTTAGTLTVSWNEVGNASGYVIQYAIDATFTIGVKTQTVASDTGTTANIESLTPGTLYYVRVMAIGTGDFTDSSYSDSASATPNLGNFNPVVTSTAPNTAVVSWEGQAPAILSECDLQYRIQGTEQWTRWYYEGVPDSPITLTGLEAGTYEFRLANPIGQTVFPMNTITVAAAQETEPSELVKPKVTVVKTGATPSSVTLTLPTSLADNDRYIITCVTKGANIAPITATGGDITIYGLKAGKSYKFTVTTVDKDGNILQNSKLKNVVASVTAKTAKYAAIKSLKMDKQQTTITSLTLTWKVATAKTDDYRVMLFDAKGKEITDLGDIRIGEITTGKVSGTMQVTITGCELGKKYTFGVVAFTDSPSNREYAESTLAKVKVTVPKYTAVQKLKLDKTAADTTKGVTASSVALQWQASKANTGDLAVKYIVLWMDGKHEKELSELPGEVTADINSARSRQRLRG